MKKASDSKILPLNIGLNARGSLFHCPDKPNCVSSNDQKVRNQIMPIYTGTKSWEEITTELESIFKDWKGAEIVSTQSNYMHITFTSSLFRFVDDLELYFDGNLQVRSASRVGHSDMGANRKRVEKLRELIAVDLKIIE